MARRRTTVSALLMVVALGVSACGGDENPGSDPSGSPSQSATTLSPTMPTSELTLGPPQAGKKTLPLNNSAPTRLRFAVTTDTWN